MKTDTPNFESLEQMADATASGLVETAAHQAFQLFRDKEFRRLSNFDVLTQIEQDRIFNELVVSYVVLIMLMLEAPDLRIPPELRDYLLGIREKIPRAHVQYLNKLGIEAQYLHDGGRLLYLRYEEYARDKHGVRAAAMQIESSEKALDLEDLSKIQIFVPVHTVAIGCYHHNCRGETRGRDDLFKLTLRFLSKFYVETRLRLEDGKMTPLGRAKIAWRKINRRKPAR